MIDIEECVALAHKTAASIQNALIKHNWIGNIIQKTRRQEYEKMFLSFLVSGSSQYSFRKSVLSKIEEYALATLDRHEIKKRKGQVDFRALCDKTCYKIAVPHLQKMMLERLNDMETNYQAILNGTHELVSETSSSIDNDHNLQVIDDEKLNTSPTKEKQSKTVRMTFKK